MTITETAPGGDTSLADTIKIVDVDTHVTEPFDLWSSRLPAKFREVGPRVEWDANGQQRWRIGDQWLTSVGFWPQAGWKDFYPSTPPTWEDVDPASYDPQRRLAMMDDFGIYAEVLYPNIIAFDSKAFINAGLDLALACVRAYNDFLVEWSSADPKRLVPIAMLPFWDIDESLKEMERAKNLGHKGLIFGSKFERIGLPPLIDTHWDPIFAAAQDAELSLNFHVGFSQTTDEQSRARTIRRELEVEDIVEMTSTGFSSNMTTISQLLVFGACERFPRLKFVSVESGFGFIPYLMEMLDWQWLNSGGHKKYPNRLMPSEYFKRQVYGTFWFEKDTLALLDGYEDNAMFETDYPHATSLTPGPASYSAKPSEVVQANMAGVSLEVTHKVLHDNAAKLYGLE